MKNFNSIGKKVDGNEGDKCNYSYRLDTYGCGCQHDCSYCYAKTLLNFRGLWNPENPSVADISKVAKTIKKLPREIIRLGGMTDCFQPIEKLHRVTYKTLKLLNRYKIPYLIVTKSAMIGDDEYIELMDKQLAHIQVTVTTTDDELSKTYEKASVPSERIKAIKKLQDNGFDVQLRLSPFIPQYIDFNILNNLGIDKICIEFLRVNSWIEKYSYMLKKMTEDIEIRYGVDYLKNKENFKNIAKKVVYSGAIDELGQYRYGELEYRGLNFEHKYYPNTNNLQGVAVWNHTDGNKPYTRTIEHNNFIRNKNAKGTIITVETPMKYKKGDERYYPINDEKNDKLYNKYKELLKDEYILIGRLGCYKYTDMAETIENTRKIFEEVEYGK